MRFVNVSGFKFAPLGGRVHPPKPSLTMIVKGTFLLRPNDAAEPAPEQIEPTGDEDPEGPLRYSSDFAPFKPNADLFVTGAKSVTIGSWCKTAGDFAPIAIASPQRMAKTGTYDKKWLKERWPWTPEDFDWTFWNAAPADQQVPYLRGDEEIRLDELQARLPGLRVRCFLHEAVAGRKEFRELRMNLDTVWTDAARLVLVWRGVSDVQSEKFVEIRDVVIASEALATSPKPAEHYRALLETKGERPIRKTRSVSLDAPPPQVRERIIRKDRFEEEDLTGADLSNLDLSGTVFVKCILLEADLHGSRLCKADLSGCNLCGANLRGADLTDARLSKCDLSDADLEGANLRGVQAQAADFTRASVAKADVRGAELSEATMYGSCVESADFSRATLRDTHLVKAWGRGTRFVEAKLQTTRFGEAVLTDAVFANAKAIESKWEGAKLFRADFSKADLSGAQMSSAYLESARFVSANLKGAIFREATLRNAGLSGANLFQAILEKADLRGADFRGANLYAAEFLESCREGAQFENANLKMTKLA